MRFIKQVDFSDTGEQATVRYFDGTTEVVNNQEDMSLLMSRLHEQQRAIESGEIGEAN